MCNLYSLTKGQAAIRDWFRGRHDRTGNILAATLMGGLFMLFYQRSESLWPVVLSHYLADLADFA